jgi:2-oxoglutarate dehydrogenase E1 component
MALKGYTSVPDYKAQTTAFYPLSANRFGRVNGRYSCIATGEAPDKVKRQMSSELESLQNSYLFGGNAPYVEELYEAYLDNPGSVPDNWRSYFDQLQHMPATDGQPATRDQAHAPIVESFAIRAKTNGFVQRAKESDLAVATKPVHVQSLIAAYRCAMNTAIKPGWPLLTVDYNSP